MIDEFPFRYLTDENSLETLISLWVQTIVCKALGWSHCNIEGRIPGKTTIAMARGGQVNHSTYFKPDWGGLALNTTKNLLSGDSKPAVK